MRIIAITGKAGSGKSSISKYLSEKYYYKRFRIAESIKVMLRSFGLSKEEVDGSLKETPCKMLCGKTPRFAMQTLGTEWGRNYIGDDIWVRMMCREIKGYSSVINVNLFCVDDLRYLNERNVLVEEFGKENVFILRVVRQGTDTGKHTSETEMDKIEADWTVFNNGTLEELYKSIDEVLTMNHLIEESK